MARILSWLRKNHVAAVAGNQFNDIHERYERVDSFISQSIRDANGQRFLETFVLYSSSHFHFLQSQRTVFTSQSHFYFGLFTLKSVKIY